MRHPGYEDRLATWQGGHCTARIEVRAAPGGCLTVDYEAVSDEHGLQHVEHAQVAEDSLYVAFGEAPGVTVFGRVAPGVFESARGMRIVAAFEDGELTWAWHWGAPGEQPVERSRARCRRAAC